MNDTNTNGTAIIKKNQDQTNSIATAALVGISIPTVLAVGEKARDVILPKLGMDTNDMKVKAFAAEQVEAEKKAKKTDK